MERLFTLSTTEFDDRAETGRADFRATLSRKHGNYLNTPSWTVDVAPSDWFSLMSAKVRNVS